MAKYWPTGTKGQTCQTWPAKSADAPPLSRLTPRRATTQSCVRGGSSPGALRRNFSRYAVASPSFRRVNACT